MPEITDPMIDAGAAILDPLLSSHCPRQVARDVYAAMEEARDVKSCVVVDASEVTGRQPTAWLNDAERRGQAIQEEARRGLTYAGELRCGPIRPIEPGPEQGMQRPAATSDGRW